MDQATWRQPPQPISNGDISEEYYADVVILGAGHAGTAAAMAAVEAGSTVIVVEQQIQARMRILGNQIGVLNSKFAQAQGVQEYDPIDLMQEWQRRTFNRANPELIRQFAWQSGATLDWFLGHLPDEIVKGIRIFMHPAEKYEGELNGCHNFLGTAYFDDMNGRGLSDAVKHVHQWLTDQGATMLFETRGLQLEKTAGRVTGLIAKRRSGDYLRLNAQKVVILAGGDFSGNREMLFDLLPEFSEITDYGRKYSVHSLGWNGEAIRMGIWAGGRMEPGPRGGMFCTVGGNGGPMDGAAFLKLNSDGNRYTNEGIYGYWGAGQQGARQKKGTIVTLWDSNWREELKYQSPDHCGVDCSDSVMMMLMETDMPTVLGTGKRGGIVRVAPPWEGQKVGRQYRVYAANSFDELADYLGYQGSSKENFLHAVERYNCICRSGRDVDFAKDRRLLHALEQPPYFGYKEENRDLGFMMVTTSGLWVDGHQRVLDQNDEPIPGLLATGNCCGCRFPIQYSTPIAGVSIGMAYTLGKIAGTYAVYGERLKIWEESL